MSTIARRKNVTLAPGELEVVERLRQQDSVERHALAELAGIDLPAKPSEAESIRALIKAGMNMIETKVAHDGYAALAASQTDEDREVSAALRGRRAAFRD